MAEIVDIPFAKWDPPEEKPVGCQHERSDGRRCGKQVWQNGLCGVHGTWHQTHSAALGLPYPEDAASLHRFLMKALDLVVSGKISERRLAALEALCRMVSRTTGYL